MALGKLWNAFFGKSAAVEKGLPSASEAPGASQTIANGETAARSPEATSVSAPAPQAVAATASAESDQPTAKVVTKVKRKAIAKDKKTATPVAETTADVAIEMAQRRVPQIAHPQQNAWTKLVAGRSIGSILDTRLGDGTRAIEVLQAIVCDSVPTPKYIAIDLFDLGSGSLTLREFHQRIRRVGGNPVAIPADLHGGLRQLSQTHGTVDLVLLDGDGIDLTSLEFRRLLARVTHDDSLVLHRDERGNWQRVPAAAATIKRTGAAESKVA